MTAKIKLDFFLFPLYDGSCHHNRKQRAKDEKKDKILNQLGWTVLRFKY